HGGGAPAAVGPAARDGRRAQVVGRSQGAVPQPGRQAARRTRRGPPPRVRRLRGDHPGRELRRGGGDRVGPGALGTARGSARRVEEGEAAVRAAGLQAPRQVDPGEAQEGRERVAPHQGEGRLRRGRRGAPAAVGAVGPDRGRAQGGGVPRGSGARAARAGPGAARRGVRRALDVRRAAVETPALLYAFDLLAFAGYDLRPLPLERRKAVLEPIVPAVGPIKYLEHFATDGEALYAQVVTLGLEGIVAKKADAPYRAGRSPNWLKIRADRTDDFAVVGFTRPRGSRSGFGALDLGAYRDGKLVYAGRVGSGFTAAQLNDVSAALEQGIRPKPAFAGPAPQDPGHTWVEPTLVAEVRYKEWTDEGLLRQPVFVRFRDDKPVAEVAILGAGKGERDAEGLAESTSPRAPLPKEVK